MFKLIIDGRDYGVFSGDAGIAAMTISDTATMNSRRNGTEPVRFNNSVTGRQIIISSKQLSSSIITICESL